MAMLFMLAVNEMTQGLKSATVAVGKRFFSTALNSLKDRGTIANFFAEIIQLLPSMQHSWKILLIVKMNSTI